MAKQTNKISLKSNKRLKFIDMARSIAILLMLEGHFIEHTFKDFKPMISSIKENGKSSSLLFDWWYFMKGFTAPMFFVVTGIVFVYLLAKNEDLSLKNNPRIFKGFKRVIELLLWGYLLQLNVRYITNTFHQEHPWIFAFHVLQSIGVGILFLILIFSLYKILNIGALYLYYFIAGSIIFCFYPYLKSLDEDVFLPTNTPEIIQNIIHGPKSVFAIVPWMAFTLYGGMIGALIIKFQDYVKKYWFAILFILIGLILNIFARDIGILLDDILDILHLEFKLIKNAWLYGRLGQVIMVIGALMIIEISMNFKADLLLKIGQNTLPIYILHVIILYGGIFGFGLNNILKHSLNGTESIIGAIIFILLFVIFIKYINVIKRLFYSLLEAIHLKK